VPEADLLPLENYYVKLNGYIQVYKIIFQNTFIMIADFTTEIKNMFPFHGKSFAVARVDLGLLHNKHQKEGNKWSDLFLCPEEKVRFSAFRFAGRQEEWLGGRISVKAAHAFLQGQEKIAWQEIIIAAADSGKPFIKNIPDKEPEIFISLSHSGGLAMGIAAFSACGIDIQEIRPAVFRVRERFSTTTERDILAHSQATATMPAEAALSIMWAGKEAVMKTFDLSPLLFFSEINLRNIKSAGTDGVILEFFCKRDKELSSRYCKVFATIIDNYAFACNLAGS
jgi:phosphopantetheinyl transferase (holo-ACP synthase)